MIAVSMWNCTVRLSGRVIATILTVATCGCQRERGSSVMMCDKSMTPRVWESLETENVHAPYVTLGDVMRLPEPADIYDLVRILGPLVSAYDGPITTYPGLPTGQYVVVFMPMKEVGWPKGFGPANAACSPVVAVIYDDAKATMNWQPKGVYVYPTCVRGKVATGFAFDWSASEGVTK